MHIEGPWLSTTGKKKGKQKFRSAEAAKQAREHAASWEALKKKYATKVTIGSTYGKISKPAPYRRDTRHIPSVDTGVTGAVSSKPSLQYTGTAMLGVATMHKSNSVPVFSQEDAVEISRMRRG